MKKSIVKLLAIGMMLGAAFVPATVASNGILPQITTTQTAKAATTDEQAQTISYKVLKTGTNNPSVSSKYFTKTATVTPNGDGTYKVTLPVEVPAIASVDIQTMNGQQVTDSAKYPKDGSNYMDVSFNINSLSDLNTKMNSQMQIKVLGLGLMKPTADFVFDTSTLKPDTSANTSDSTDTDAPVTKPADPIIKDPTGTDTTTPDTSTDNSGSQVVIGDPVTTDSNAATAQEQDIPYQVLKADASQGESVSTQFFTGKSKVTPNGDGTYKVTMTMTYLTTFGTEPVTINSINGGSINPDKKTYSQDGKNFMDFSFNISSMKALDSLIPCAMSIDVSNLGFNSDESVNFKFGATSSGVAASSNVAANNGAGSGSSTYGSTQNWPTGTTGSATAANPSTSNSTLPQTGNTSNSVILTVIGLAVASMSVILFKKTNGFKA
ncbi:NEAT domain-containing protein [Companilactobacillus ginsenosidimutans]|uniref:Gram-positive cocci surface proteins LPxTG domain-containing protein n=1 Tax=Companilactobacillus ginsenosidimutans TaxID=1007676 RepID=A0A0H4R1C9_9LACO|nr:NEAT domain-containing protein [Companilactobacillus ginsenosidimutans]AKP67520.1 hypothetical protein ABM34_08250 [Companilactobacillus ginsenosidimutans]